MLHQLMGQGMVVTARMPCPISVAGAFMGQVLNCRILVKQHLSEGWTEWFNKLHVQNLPTGEALLFGPLPDHAALYGVLTHMRDLGIQILSVDAIPQQEP